MWNVNGLKSFGLQHAEGQMLFYVIFSIKSSIGIAGRVMI